MGIEVRRADRRGRAVADREAQRDALDRARDELAGQVLNALVERVGLEPGEIEDVQMGCVTQIGEQGWNVGRMGRARAGWPETVSGTTVDRQWLFDADELQRGGGPVRAARSRRLRRGGDDVARPDGLERRGDLSDRLHERWQIVPQGISAEVIADEWEITRVELDEYSLESHRRADRRDRRRQVRERDRAGRRARWAARPARRSRRRRSRSTRRRAGTRPRRGWRRSSPRSSPRVATAGSSSQICDGTAAVLIASESAVSRLTMPRHASPRLGSGVDPHRMLHGNPEACANALARADLTWDDIAVVEVNEAFASVPIQFMRDTGLTERWADVNPNGGGISLGHPLGVTGARVTATPLNERTAVTSAM